MWRKTTVEHKGASIQNLQSYCKNKTLFNAVTYVGDSLQISNDRSEESQLPHQM